VLPWVRGRLLPEALGQLVGTPAFGTLAAMTSQATGELTLSASSVARALGVVIEDWSDLDNAAWGLVEEWREIPIHQVTVVEGASA
jgi:hypothetical protein